MQDAGTRARILDVALRLFATHSFAGTSLQMIADEMALTKAAVYHHFHTREDLLTALITPALAEMRAVADDADAQRTPHARAEHMLTGFVELAVRHRRLIAILSNDQAILRLLKSQSLLDELLERPVALLRATAPEPAGRINALLTLSGVGSTAGSELLADIDDEDLRRYLVETGRRILGLRAPRTARVPAR